MKSSMPLGNFDRMIQLATEVFDTKNDPNQLDITPEVLAHLEEIHPASVSEYDDGNGPVAWILLLPTSIELMNKFLNHSISEKELYEQTPLSVKYEALYLCSAMVLEEYRRKGIAKQLILTAIENIRHDHPLKALFVWSFSKEGNLGAEALSKFVSLPLFKRT